MGNSEWYSIYLVTDHDGRKYEQPRLIAVVRSPGLAYRVYSELVSVFGKENLTWELGKK